MNKKSFIKKILPVFLLCMLLNMQITVFAQDTKTIFEDVSSSHPNAKAIEYLKTEGIINGYTDGTFKPDQPVNRAEALSIALKAKKITFIEKSSSLETFNDVLTTDWFFKAVYTAEALKIISGNPDGSFGPAKNVNKVEFLKMLLLAFEIKFLNYEPPKKSLFTDTTDNKQWFIPYLDFSKNVNIIEADKEGKIYPNQSLNRGEVAEIVYKLLIIMKGGPAQLLKSRTEAALSQSILDLQQGNIVDATANIKNAKVLTTQALEKTPNENTIKAIAKIIESFEKLLQSFTENQNKKYQSAIKLAGEAYNLADEAITIDSSSKEFATEVKNLAKNLADSIREK